MCADESDKQRRLLLPLKTNIAPDVGGLAFAIMPHGLDNQPIVCWESEPVTVTAEDIIGHKPRKRGPEAEERREAEDWLRKQLANRKRAAGEVIEEADEIGFSKRTIQRALRAIGGKSKKCDFSGGWEWSLGEDSSQAHPENLAPS